ncbi:hypothetical protein H072_2211 [Dactylellina haptotyla CBS 200.50]|uniref:Enterotoxin n=1 Tax=Dactylellina haptotyla (strain CBS 200.50) TaxID=1284197 RepID=S8C7T9_DACHA|nr:hypothetical protein H072_2211 [Dactylellina haptotyla CBS 200.50]
MLAKVGSVRILILQLLLSLPTLIDAYAWAFVRQAETALDGVRPRRNVASGEVKGPAPRLCAKINYGRGAHGIVDLTLIVAMKVWTVPMYGRGPWAFALYPGTNGCSSSGNKPSLVIRFHPSDGQTDTLQFADWEGIAKATDSWWKYGSWEELKPNTTMWEKYIDGYDLQPGEILFDSTWGNGDDLVRVNPELASVKQWDLSKLGLRFSEEPWIMRNDYLMSRVASGEISVQQLAKIKEAALWANKNALPLTTALWDSILNGDTQQDEDLSILEDQEIESQAVQSEENIKIDEFSVSEDQSLKQEYGSQEDQDDWYKKEEETEIRYEKVEEDPDQNDGISEINYDEKLEYLSEPSRDSSVILKKEEAEQSSINQGGFVPEYYLRNRGPTDDVSAKEEDLKIEAKVEEKIEEKLEVGETVQHRNDPADDIELQDTKIEEANVKNEVKEEYKVEEEPSIQELFPQWQWGSSENMNTQYPSQFPPIPLQALPEFNLGGPEYQAEIPKNLAQQYAIADMGMKAIEEGHWNWMRMLDQMKRNNAMINARAAKNRLGVNKMVEEQKIIADLEDIFRKEEVRLREARALEEVVFPDGRKGRKAPRRPAPPKRTADERVLDELEDIMLDIIMKKGYDRSRNGQ